MVNLNLQSLALNLSVLALTLIVLWVVEKRGKQADIKSIGTSLIIIGIVVLAVGFGSVWTQGLQNQWNLFKNTGLSILTSGILLLIRMKVQKKPANLIYVFIGAIIVGILALGFLIWSLVSSKNGFQKNQSFPVPSSSATGNKLCPGCACLCPAFSLSW